jgi:hypothetical protein
MNLQTKLTNWYKRFEAYAFWEDDSEERSTPLISFSVDAWLLETIPAHYYEYNDKNRWRSIHFRMKISKYLMAISIPYKMLPDYVPTDKLMLRTRRVQAEHQAKLEAERNALTKV